MLSGKKNVTCGTCMHIFTESDKLTANNSENIEKLKEKIKWYSWFLPPREHCCCGPVLTSSEPLTLSPRKPLLASMIWQTMKAAHGLPPRGPDSFVPGSWRLKPHARFCAWGSGVQPKLLMLVLASSRAICGGLMLSWEAVSADVGGVGCCIPCGPTVPACWGFLSLESHGL